MYHAHNGEIHECFPHQWSYYGITHIESMPFFHAIPGARILCVGTAGCNLTCQYCSNAYVARADPTTVNLYDITPERLVALAQKSGCHAIVFGVNEPTVSMPTFTELSRTAREAGIRVGCLTNGYMTENCATVLKDHVSFINISLKSLTSSFYRNYAGVPDVKPVLRNIRTLAENCHVELTTPIVQGVNDHEIDAMAEFIAGIDKDIPWHVFRLLPEHRMAGEKAPDVRNIDKQLDYARSILPYVYFSNFVGSKRLNTLCPACGEVVIERVSPGGCGGRNAAILINDNRCPECGAKIPIHGPCVRWNSAERVVQ